MKNILLMLGLLCSIMVSIGSYAAHNDALNMQNHYDMYINDMLLDYNIVVTCADVFTDDCKE